MTASSRFQVETPEHAGADTTTQPASDGAAMYFEGELQRLRQWCPKQSRFRAEMMRRTSEDGTPPRPPHAFSNHCACDTD